MEIQTLDQSSNLPKMLEFSVELLSFKVLTQVPGIHIFSSFKASKVKRKYQAIVSAKVHISFNFLFFVSVAAEKIS